LRGVAELLASIGYEPHISLYEINVDKVGISNANAIKIGIAGFCFANIMLISFPEYLGLSYVSDHTLTKFFRLLNLGISLPVIFYCANEFFINALHSFKQKYLNIDTPIAFAITITFSRSVYEILTNTGAGYLDSMSGIVFFMLIGRALQSRTQSALKFNRDYKSYFPIAVTLIDNEKESSIQIDKIKTDDVLLLHHQEIIPVDCILSKGKAEIDYSFITGEIESHYLKVGEIIYAGGKVIGSNLEVITLKPFSQNNFTQLWNNSVFKTKTEPYSFVTNLNKYFSFALFTLAISAFVYWRIVDPSKALDAFTAALIVACPCSLLLTSSFTFGYIIELFTKHRMFVKSKQTIEEMAKANHIVFDKTGTITEANQLDIHFEGKPLNEEEKTTIFSCMQQSMHPFSRAIIGHYKGGNKINITNLKEVKGFGIEAWVNEQHVKIGSSEFVGVSSENKNTNSFVFIKFDEEIKGKFIIENIIKEGIIELFRNLNGYNISLLSGDNESSKMQMKELFPKNSILLYKQLPEEKLQHILELQNQGKKVMMVGDGLNDAGALKQSNCGISIVQNHFSFSPACDAIFESKNINKLSAFIQSAKDCKRLIQFTFAYSILYNVVGLSIAVSGHLEPIIAAILMPSSSISIILISFLGTKYIEKKNFS
jgi:Cu+-exporting ATPase